MTQQAVPLRHVSPRARLSTVAVLVWMLTGLLALISLTGCGSPAPCCQVSEPATSLAIVIQAADNSTRPYLPDAVVDEVTGVLADGGAVSVINADGTPSFLLSDVRVDGADLAESVKQDQATLLYNEVVETVLGAEPDSDGIDMVGALNLAGTAGAGARPVVAVLGSGLSDTGTYDATREGMTLSPADQLVGQLADEDLPALDGTQVRWWWLGQGTGDQKPLAPAQASNVAAFYETLIARSGGRLTIEKGSPDTSLDAMPTTYAVRPVPPAGTTVVPVGVDAGVDVFDGTSQLSFAFDSDRFLDLATAQETAAQYAQWLAKHPDGTLAISGTTASAGEANHLQELSTRRAEAFAALIVAHGGDPARVSAVGRGIGPNQPDGEGTPGEDTAKVLANRAVTVERRVG